MSNLKNRTRRNRRNSRNNRNHRGGAVCVPGTVFASQKAAMASGCPWTNDAGVFKVATSAAVTTWDPIQSFSTEAFYMTNVYEPLLWKNADGVTPEYSPALATSWTSSSDGKTWTFKLRAGATNLL